MADPLSSISPIPEPQRAVQVLVVRPWKQRYWLHIVLFLGTIFTTLVVGARMQHNFQHNLPPFYEADDSLPIFPLSWALHASNLALGIPFSLTLMVILLAHEMGHYLYCRRYGVWATLPFFIPFPTLIGTLGAFIRIRSPIRSRATLFDIGIAGPIAGFVVALAVLVFTLGMSKVAPVVGTAQPIELNYPVIFLLVHYLERTFSVSYGMAGAPLSQLSPHPMAIAAWIGMFATALNLLPGGQLDGGHIVFSLAPGAHKFVSRITILGLFFLAYYCWAGWLLWAILLGISGMRHPVVASWPGIGGGRRAIAAFGLIMLLLTFTAAPFANASLPEVVRQIRGR